VADRHDFALTVDHREGLAVLVGNEQFDDPRQSTHPVAQGPQQSINALARQRRHRDRTGVIGDQRRKRCRVEAIGLVEDQQFGHPVGVDFVLFDAEEYVFGPRDPYCIGSTFFARQHAADRRAARLDHEYRCGVVVDMVADRDLVIWQELNSVEWPDTRPVVDGIWDTARRLGIRQFVPRPRHRVEDDHVPLRMIGGIPTCDIIDFDYPAWHTTDDTPERCAGESLEAVGGVLLAWLREQR